MLRKSITILLMLIALVPLQGQEINSFPHTEDFEQGYTVELLNNFHGWTVIDGDGYYSFMFSQPYTWTHYARTTGGHNNSRGFMLSESYHSEGSRRDYLQPDNWLISPKIVLPDRSIDSLSFWMQNHLADWYTGSDWVSDEFSLYISDSYTGGGRADDTVHFTTLVGHYITQKNWQKVTIDLSSYQGKEIYIAIRHHHPGKDLPTDLLIDDVEITSIAYDTIIVTHTPIVRCDTAEYNGTTYHNSTTVYDTTHHLPHDTLRIQEITIHPSYNYSLDTTLTDYGKLTWHDTTFYNDVQFDRNTKSTHGCDSTLHLGLTIQCPAEYGAEKVLTACDTLKVNGRRVSKGEHHLYDTLKNIRFCDSIIPLHLYINPTYSNLKDTFGCYTLEWKGEILQNDTIVAKKYQSVENCDSITGLHFHIGNEIEIYDTVHSCIDYLYRGIYFDKDSSHTYTPGRHPLGCDSTIHLHVIIHQPTDTTIDTASCDTLEYLGTTYLTSTRKTITLQNAYGCDSTIHLNLTIYNSDMVPITPQGCDSTLWDNIYYLHDTTLYDTTANTYGCDSITAISILVHSTYHTRHDTTACDFLFYNSINFSHDTIATLHNLSLYHCDSIDTLHLTMRYSKKEIKTVEACDAYRWHDSTYRNSSIDVYRTKSLEECDSVITLMLTIIHSDTTDTTITACDSLKWHDKKYYMACTDTFFYHDNACHTADVLHLTIHYADTSHTIIPSCITPTSGQNISSSIQQIDTVNQYGCDSTVILHLNVYHNTTGIFYATVCDSFEWHNTTYYESTTTPTYKRQNKAGCDSTITLHLTILRQPDRHDTIFTCNQYTYNDITYTTDTTLKHTIERDVNNCDSAAWLHLVVEYGNDSNVIRKENCDSIVWRDNTYTHTDTLTNISHTPHGCTHTEIVYLTVYHSKRGGIDTSSCDSLRINGTLYLTSLNKTDYQPTAEGCDSIYTTNITIHHSKTTKIDTAIYDSLPWNGTTYTQTTSHKARYATAHGCDSNIDINILIINLPRPEIIDYDEQLLMTNHYPDGEEGKRTDYYAYQWYCDSIAIDNATNDMLQAKIGKKFDGCYYVSVAIDEEKRHWISSNSICFSNPNGIDDIPTLPCAIHPNPAKTGKAISITTSAKAEAKLYNMLGIEIFKTTTEADTEKHLTMPQQKGIYLLVVTDQQGRVAKKSIVVE